MKAKLIAASAVGETLIWDGDGGRTPRVQRPCHCGCDSRGGVKGVGYITGSDSKGHGFTIWITDEKLFSTMEKAFASGKKKSTKSA